MNQETSFPTVKSETNPLGSFLIRALLFLLLTFAFALFFLLPIYGIYKRGFEQMLWPSVICFSLSFLIIIPGLYYYFIQRKKLASEIIINEKGIFYHTKNENITEQILYTELCSSDEMFDIQTVTTKSSGILPLLNFYIHSEKNGKIRKRLDMNLPLLAVNNKTVLYAHFLLGIRTFRPDLTISSSVYDDYYIDKITGKVNLKKQKKSILIIILMSFLFTAIILLLIYLFI